MRRLEYKTVAMPQLLKARRRRGQSRDEMVAEIVSQVINKQAGLGWRYAGADTFKCVERRGFFGAVQETAYTVLVFDREALGEPEFDEERTEPAAAAPGRSRRRAAEVEPEPETASPERRSAFGFSFGGGSRREPQEPAEPRGPERRRADERGAERTAERPMRNGGLDPDHDFHREHEEPAERRGPARMVRRAREQQPEPGFDSEDEAQERAERLERMRSRGPGGPARGRRVKN